MTTGRDQPVPQQGCCVQSPSGWKWAPLGLIEQAINKLAAGTFPELIPDVPEREAEAG